ncbi:hypothetical protein J5N97_027267 [Dioscorea zingiberensis]|uniref:PGG domain-containing protein n=1 Tax=Dioscorea zingiberensis TaxID=325984 RepID=A0A9D5C4H8_9LILI|nr:hypothetical protein J5N97_027267 [Dioscorea zingiberensis]
MAKFADNSHSTPLHYVAADGDENMTRILLEHDPSIAYISDKDGYFPIHVAASMDHVRVIQQIMKQCPDSLELVDHKGRNFFHVAVVNRSLQVVRYVIGRGRGLEKLLNQRDNEGNTPLHLAVRDELPKRLVYTLFIPQRSDYAIQAARDQAYDPEKEEKKRTSLSKNMAIASVLIATVPGGYNSDNGTSILTRKYPFKVFLISDTCAMIFSLIATVLIIYAGTPFMDNSLREFHIMCSICMLWISFACMSVAFGMASFVVVVPKAWGLGVLVCILSFIAPLVTIVISDVPLIYARCVIIWRNGRMRSNIDPHTRRRLPDAWVLSFWIFAGGICLLLLVYVMPFLLALL